MATPDAPKLPKQTAFITVETRMLVIIACMLVHSLRNTVAEEFNPAGEHAAFLFSALAGITYFIVAWTYASIIIESANVMREQPAHASGARRVVLIAAFIRALMLTNVFAYPLSAESPVPPFVAALYLTCWVVMHYAYAMAILVHEAIMTCVRKTTKKTE